MGLESLIRSYKDLGIILKNRIINPEQELIFRDKI
jgi:hypothetical protein